MADLASLCVPSTFTPSLTNIDVISTLASPVANFSGTASESLYWNNPTIEVTDASFCNVTISYTHPGINDAVNVTVWLPISGPEWNGRLQAVGGGAWVAGGGDYMLANLEMTGAIGQGFATVTTDAGNDPGDDDVVNDPTYVGMGAWAEVSPGNPNIWGLKRLGTFSLEEEALLAKQVIANFYGTGPSYSYWSGCSQGGRQGLALAQRFPDLYDGIAAAAPAIGMVRSISGSVVWPRIVMHNLLNDVRPPDCEAAALTQMVIDDCDGLDGLVDGIIFDQEACDASLDIFSHVGKEFVCTTTNKTSTISHETALYANATWTGPRNSGGWFMWYGPSASSSLTNPQRTNFEDQLAGEFLRSFAARDPDFDVDTLSFEDFEFLFNTAVADYSGLLDVMDPDLRRFKARGGKLITYHGTADQLLPEKVTAAYVEDVMEVTGGLDDFYKYYRVPGMGHCAGGSSDQPTTLFAALMDWVENGNAPQELPIGMTINGTIKGERILCPYPQKAVWDGVGDSTLKSSFYCQAGDYTGPSDAL